MSRRQTLVYVLLAALAMLLVARRGDGLVQEVEPTPVDPATGLPLTTEQQLILVREHGGSGGFI